MSMGNFNAGGQQGGGGKGGFQGPDTGAPGGGGQDYNGNPVGGGMGLQFNTGGAQPQPGFGMQPGQFGQPPQGQFQPQPGRFQPGGMIPPAGARTGAYTRQRAPQGDPRRYSNPGGVPPMQPGMPAQPVFRDIPGYGGGKGGYRGPGLTPGIQINEGFGYNPNDMRN